MRPLALAALALPFVTGAAFAQPMPPSSTTFDLHVNDAFIHCLSEGSTPSVTVTVKRGELADTATITGYGFKPGLQFDLFTIQRSSLDAQGAAVPSFPGFGLAWYQTDLRADSYGSIQATIKTILLDQIFGFDGDKRPDGTTVLAPTNTFHVGFWFNNPQDAASCGFDVTKPTPFNGEHKAGPLAFISLPSAESGLGPLCTSPQGSGDTATCNP